MRFEKLILFTVIAPLAMLASGSGSEAAAPPPLPEKTVQHRLEQPQQSPAEPAVPFAEEAAPQSRAETVLAGMTREEKVWQLMVLFPKQAVESNVETDAAVWKSALERRPAGALVFDHENILEEASLRDMLTAAGSAGEIAPLLCVDEEGGAVARIASSLGVTTKFKSMYSYRDQGVSGAYANAKTIGEDIRSFGFHVDFAPVADVWTNPRNTVIGKRAYSDDPEEAALLVGAAVRGFRDAGVIPVLKHFPGHGDTAEDSHVGIARSGKTAEELAACELLPFCAGMEAGARMVMVGHITLPQLDPAAPATLSPVIVTQLLRGALGFDGVVITDALKMSALRDYDGPEAARLAIEAGCDLLLVPDNPDAVAGYLLQTVSEARLDESVLRILRLKEDAGLLEASRET